MSGLLVLLVTVLFHLQNPQIDEASGIARGVRSSDVYYVQNDSGDRARFFAIDRRTGATRAVYVVPGARNVDWEDIAVARDARGTSSVWIADIGDNGARRPQITVYRVDEPVVPRGSNPGEHGTALPDIWRLRYPGGPRDAEALLVDPITHHAYIVTKSFTGTSEVYAVPLSPQGGRVQTLRTVTTLGVPGIISGPRQLAITGGVISQDGGRLVLRTYTDAYEWPLRHGDVASALRAQPESIALPEQPQGEGVTIDGSTIVIDSEGVGTAVYSVELPPVRTPTVSASPIARPRANPVEPTGSGDHRRLYAAAALVALVGLVGLTVRAWLRRASVRRQ